MIVLDYFFASENKTSEFEKKSLPSDSSFSSLQLAEAVKDGPYFEGSVSKYKPESFIIESSTTTYLLTSGLSLPELGYFCNCIVFCNT